MQQAKFSIRPANESDVDALYSLDLVARCEDRRRELIRRAVASGACYVATAEDEVVGYGVLNYNFYDNGWIEMLYVHSGYRRRGVAEALLRHLEQQCERPKLFISTNLSNLAMQSLLAKLSYVRSGVIHNLDQDDPEIVYFKRLR